MDYNEFESLTLYGLVKLICPTFRIKGLMIGLQIWMSTYFLFIADMIEMAVPYKNKICLICFGCWYTHIWSRRTFINIVSKKIARSSISKRKVAHPSQSNLIDIFSYLKWIKFTRFKYINMLKLARFMPILLQNFSSKPTIIYLWQQEPLLW